MPIQWFPGHMHATRKAIVDRLPDIDVVIELLDARFPGSSSNPLLAELTAGKPSLKVLNKQDMADAARTAAWLDHFNARDQTRALGLDASQAAPARALIAACRALAPNRGGMVKPLRVLICGVPNVGKSTLVNSLAGQRRAATGDEAGITKTEQRITLADDFYLFDTPGMLWPRITVERSGHHLAAGGSVGRNAFDEQEVATALLHSVRGPYADRLRSRYKLGELDGFNDDELLAEIGRKRGALMGGGRIDLQKAAEISLADFRSGAWGRITLETPQEFEAWWAEGQARDALRAAKKAARKAKPTPQRDLPRDPAREPAPAQAPAADTPDAADEPDA